MHKYYCDMIEIYFVILFFFQKACDIFHYTPMVIGNIDLNLYGLYIFGGRKYCCELPSVFFFLFVFFKVNSSEVHSDPVEWLIRNNFGAFYTDSYHRVYFCAYGIAIFTAKLQNMFFFLLLFFFYSECGFFVCQDYTYANKSKRGLWKYFYYYCRSILIVL